MDERDILEGEHRISVFGDTGQFTFQWVSQRGSEIEFLPEESVEETVPEPVETLLTENGYILQKNGTQQTTTVSDQWPIEIQVSYNITDRMQLDRIVTSELPGDSVAVKETVKNLSQVAVTYRVDSDGTAEMITAEDVTVGDRLDATTEEEEDEETGDETNQQ